MQNTTKKKIFELIIYFLFILALLILILILFINSPSRLLKYTENNLNTKADMHPALKNELQLKKANIIISAYKNELYAHNLTTKKKLWKITNKYPVCSLGRIGNQVVAAYRNSKGCNEILTFNYRTGTYLNNHSFPFGTPPFFRNNKQYLTVFNKNQLQVWDYSLISLTDFKINKNNSSNCIIVDGLSSSNGTSIIEKCTDYFKLSIIKTEPPENVKSQLIKSEIFPLNKNCEKLSLRSIYPHKVELYAEANKIKKLKNVFY